MQTPQVCVRFSSNFRHCLILFHQPTAIRQSRAVRHPCNPYNQSTLRVPVLASCIRSTYENHAGSVEKKKKSYAGSAVFTLLWRYFTLFRVSKSISIGNCIVAEASPTFLNVSTGRGRS